MLTNIIRTLREPNGVFNAFLGDDRDKPISEQVKNMFDQRERTMLIEQYGLIGEELDNFIAKRNALSQQERDELTDFSALIGGDDVLAEVLTGNQPIEQLPTRHQAKAREWQCTFTKTD